VAGNAEPVMEVAAAMREEPSDDLALPRGLFLVAREEGAVLGCAGLRLLPGRIGEVTRVFGPYVDHCFEKALG
jgi:hypothetical protein